MTISKEQVTRLLGENNLPEDVIVNLRLMVEKAIDENVDQKTSMLEEALDNVTKENVKLKEAAEAYGDYVKAEYESKYYKLQEQAETYGDYAKTETEKIERKLTQQAEAYAEYVKDEYANENLKLQESAEAYGDYVVNQISNDVDSYLDYVVGQFVNENKDAIVDSIEFKRMKSVFNEMKNSFAKHAFSIDSDQAVDEIQDQLRTSIQENNKALAELSAAKKKASELSKSLIFEQSTKHLADTQKDKVAQLVERVRFGSDYEYKRGIELVIEEIIDVKSTSGRSKVLSESFKPNRVAENNINLLNSALPTPTPQASIEDRMASYLNCLK